MGPTAFAYTNKVKSQVWQESHLDDANREEANKETALNQHMEQMPCP